MHDQTPLDEDDTRLLRRVRRRGERGFEVSRETALRVAWVCVRRWGDPEAGERLGACLAGAITPEQVEGLIRTVRAADLASSTPARSSAEFLWRHPELIARPDPPDHEDPEPPARGEGIGSRLVRSLRGRLGSG